MVWCSSTAGTAVFRHCSGQRWDGVQILQAGKSGVVFRYCRQVSMRWCSDTAGKSSSGGVQTLQAGHCAVVSRYCAQVIVRCSDTGAGEDEHAVVFKTTGVRVYLF